MTDAASSLPAAYLAHVADVIAQRPPGRHYRQMPKPPYRKAREIDGVLYSICRLCAAPIRCPDGAPDRRRMWHPACVDMFLAATDPGRLRAQVFSRDHGVCAGCGLECARLAEDGEPWWKRHNRIVDGVTWVELHEWEADHIVPIIDGGLLELANVQTLCAACHRAKTAREATARAERRRRAAREQCGQIDLWAEDGGDAG